MKKFRRIALSLVLAVALLVGFALPVAAANPTVSITVTAQVVSITNTQSSWGIGTVVVDAVVYFSATGAQDDDYSQIENTGNVAVDIEIQGENLVATNTTFNWVLATAAGSEQYSLYANQQGTPTVYDVEVKSSAYGDLTTNLAADATFNWSMKFTAPTAFNANDDGEGKAATVTFVASKYTA